MKHVWLYLSILIMLIGACKQRFSPKPTGYIRIDLEKKIDALFYANGCPFSFRTSNYFKLNTKENCWMDLEYKKHHATIHLTYKKINGNLFNLLEESRNMVYKHTIKANAINEKIYSNNFKRIYATLYDIEGETASSVQFHVTDSINNFLRGALYFRVTPNQDSLAPIINYLRDDIIRIMETLEWDEKIVSEK